MNVLPSTAASPSRRRSSGDEPVESRRDQGMQGLGHLERVDLADELVDGAFLYEQAAVEQHPHRLHRVQGNAFGAGEDPVPQRHRQPGYEPDQQLLHRLRRERLQVERGEVAVAGPPGRAPLE